MPQALIDVVVIAQKDLPELLGSTGYIGPLLIKHLMVKINNFFIGGDACGCNGCCLNRRMAIGPSDVACWQTRHHRMAKTMLSKSGL